MHIKMTYPTVAADLLEIDIWPSSAQYCQLLAYVLYCKLRCLQADYVRYRGDEMTSLKIL